MKIDESMMPEPKVSTLDRIGAAGTLMVAIFLVAFSVFSLVIDLLIQFNFAGIIVDLIFACFGLFAGYFALRSLARAFYYERMMDSAFEDGVYKRMEPILRKVAEVSVDLEDLESHLNIVDKKVQTVLEEQVSAQTSTEIEKNLAPGTSIAFVVKAVFMVVITMAGFLFMLEYPFGINHYLTLIFYVLWWIFITSEFKVFDNNTAWASIIAPILLVPVGIMLLDAIWDVNVATGAFYAILALYALLYYLWAVYETKGTLPLSGPNTQNLGVVTNSLETDQAELGFIRGFFGGIKSAFLDFLGFRRK